MAGAGEVQEGAKGGTRMKDIYRNCPFCGNEVGEGEETCSYCKASVRNSDSYADLHRGTDLNRVKERYSHMSTNHRRDIQKRHDEETFEYEERGNPIIDGIKRILDYFLNY